MDRKKIQQITEKLAARTEGGFPPKLRFLPEGEGFSPSLQNELMKESGIWPFLQIWDARQFRMKME